MLMVDLSGMMSVCIKTGDQSRINVLSALISMGLASRASATQEVGLITPYHAQSRLLHAMAHDLEEQAAGFKKISCATVHQFQGSERDVILYDAVDCYRMAYPGVLLSSTTNQYANRLFNVAVTRARGKLIVVANVSYLKSKGLAKSLMFRQMIDDSENGGSVSGNKIFDSFGGPNLRYFEPSEGGESFLKDVRDAKTEIRIDVPGQQASEQTVYQKLGEELKLARARGVRVVVRAEDLSAVPKPLKPYALENRFISDPITLVDKKIVWYGFPPSEANFMSEGTAIPTKYRPVIRFAGRRFASALYGLLEMSKTTNPKAISEAPEKQEKYDTFATYCSAELRCKHCGKPYLLKKSRGGRFFLACSGYPACENTEKVTPELIDSYLYFNNKKGRHCPQDHTSLEGATGKYGAYVRCNNGSKPHYYKLDEI